MYKKEIELLEVYFPLLSEPVKDDWFEAYAQSEGLTGVQLINKVLNN